MVIGKNPKRTKRFAKDHLAATIAQRRKEQKYNQKKTGKKGALKKVETGFEDESDEDAGIPKAYSAKLKPSLEAGDMDGPSNVDKFLEEDFFRQMEEGENEDDDDDAEDEEEEVVEKNSKGKKKAAAKEGKKTDSKKKSKQQPVREIVPESDEEEDDEGDDDNEDDEDEIVMHQRHLKELQKKDPEFFEYLKAHDKGLLEFEDDGEAQLEAEGEEEAEEQEEEGDDGEAAEEPVKRREQLPDEDLEDTRPVLSMKELKQFIDGAIKAEAQSNVRDIMRAFESGVFMDKQTKRENLWKVSSSAVYQQLMSFCVASMDSVLDTYLQLKPNARGRLNPVESVRWKHIKKSVKAYLTALDQLMTDVTDGMMMHALVRHAERLLHYFGCFPKICRALLKTALHIWMSADDNRVSSFLLIRNMSVTLPFPFIEFAYKGIYLTFQKAVRATNVNNVESQRFMAQCVVELYGLDPNVAYEHAFVYIRQLAIQLRNAITQKGKDARAQVGSWEFLNSLRMWGRCLTQYADGGNLRPLLYPLVQVSLGAMRLLNGARWLPFRLQVCETLIHLSIKNHSYIPIAPFLEEVLSMPEMNRQRKTNSAPQGQVLLFASLHLGPAVLATQLFQDTAMTEMLRLLTMYCAAYCYSIAFPEIAFPTCVVLRRFAKHTSNPKHRRLAKDFLDKVERSIQWAERTRGTLELAPKDIKTMDTLRPQKQLPGKAACPLAHEVLESQQAVEGDGWEASAKKQPLPKNEGDEDDEMDDNEEDDDEVEDMSDFDDDDDEEEEEQAPRKGKKGKKEKKKPAEKASSKKKHGENGTQQEGNKKRKMPAANGSQKKSRALLKKQDVVEDLSLSDDE